MWSEIESRPRGHKHLLCKAAETELVLMSSRIANIRSVIATSDYRMIGFAPLDSTSQHPIPPISTKPIIQERMDNMESTVVHVACYVKLHANDTDLPDVTFNGRTWLKSFLKQWRNVQFLYRGLVQDTIYQMIALMIAVGLDTAHHSSFYAKYQATLTVALEMIQDALPSLDTPQIQSEFCLYFIQHRFKEYMKLPATERLLPNAGSLSERALVQRITLLFEINLKRWDRLHGLRVPVVRRILEVFAYDMERKYDQGIYNLTPLFVPVDSEVV